MRLVGEARGERGLGKAETGPDPPAHAVELAHGAKAGRAGAESGTEAAGERPAIETGQPLQLGERMPPYRLGRDSVADPAQRGEIEPAAARVQRSGQDG